MYANLFAAELGYASIGAGADRCEAPGYVAHEDDGWMNLYGVRPLDGGGIDGVRRCVACAWRHLHELRERTPSA